MDTEFIEKYYDRLASQYHQDRRDSKKFFNESIEIPATLSLAKKYSFRKVLDVGCGTGILSKLLENELSMRVIGIDVSQRMLDIAEESCQGMAVKFVKCSFHDHNPKTKYDLVIGSFFLGYESNLVEAFAKTKSLLNSNGGAIFSIIHPIRMCMSEHDDQTYRLSDYFTESSHKVVTVPGEEPLLQPRRTFETIIEAARDSGFALSRLLEPKPAFDMGDSKRFEFYHKFPTVAVFEFVAGTSNCD
jgi:predicted TPR repeat methyltransferase